MTDDVMRRVLPCRLSLCVAVTANALDGTCQLYAHPGMGASEGRVAARAGLTTLVLHEDNAQVRRTRPADKH